MHICSTCLLVHKINTLLSLSSQCRPFSRRHTRIHVFSQGIRRFALRTGRNRQLFTEKQFKGECGYLHRTIIPSHIDRLSSPSSERLIFTSSSFNITCWPALLFPPPFSFGGPTVICIFSFLYSESHISADNSFSRGDG